MGACHRAPAAALGHELVEHATPERLAAALRRRAAGAAGAAGPCRLPGARRLCRAAPGAGRGRGGARARCWRCWRPRRCAASAAPASPPRASGGWCMAQPAPRHLVVNADEGEPGTFKDRYCLETEPHRVLEGMLIAAEAIGAEACWIYLRDEYPHLRRMLEREIAALAQAGLARMPIHLRRGAGAYICGEETALLESLEGTRGYPRHKPPFPGEHGLFGRPTLIHNVETLWLAAGDLLGTPEAAATLRRAWAARAAGAALLQRHRPGARARREAGAGRRHRARTGRGILPAACCRVIASPPICPAAPRAASCRNAWPTCRSISARWMRIGCFVGSGAVVVLSDQDDLAEAARNLVRFFRDESCGQCTPCRVGTAKAAAAAGRAALGPRAAGGTGGGDGGWLDLRPRPGGDEPGAHAAAPLPGGGRHDPLHPGWARGRGGAGREPLGRRAARGHGDPASLPPPAPGYRPDGNCRACLVEIEGERVLAASCIRTPRDGMVVRTATRARRARARRMVFELLLADQPGAAGRDATAGFAALDAAARRDRLALRAARRQRPAPDLSHPAMAVQLDACIQCGLCERACREVQHNDVIGLARRGMEVTVSFDLLDPMGASSCVACGECVQACPTGALLPKSVLDEAGHRAARAGDARSPASAPIAASAARSASACATGAIEEVVGRDGPSNQGRLCVKGRFGFDYLRAPGPADPAADPHRAEGPGGLPRPAQRACEIPRGELGGGAGAGRRWPRPHPRPARGRMRWPASARPRARTRRPTCSRSWSAPASAPTTSTTARGSATRPRVAALLEGIGSRRRHRALHGRAPRPRSSSSSAPGRPRTTRSPPPS